MARASKKEVLVAKPTRFQADFLRHSYLIDFGEFKETVLLIPSLWVDDDVDVCVKKKPLENSIMTLFQNSSKVFTNKPILILDNYLVFIKTPNLS